MDAAQLEAYMHERIPLSGAMGMRVRVASDTYVELSAPLAPNINHRQTVFGGSSSALATLAAWALVFRRLAVERIDARVVIRRGTTSFDKPVPGDFSASCHFDDREAWAAFLATFAEKRRARIRMRSSIRYADETVGAFEGEFVALAATED